MEEERGGTGHPKLVLTLAEARLDLDTGFSALGWHIEGNDKKKKKLAAEMWPSWPMGYLQRDSELFLVGVDQATAMATQKLLEPGTMHTDSYSAN